MYTPIKFLINYFCRLILYLIGWKVMDDDLLDILRKTPKCVIIYPHTTYWDFVLMFFYKFSYPELWDRLYPTINENSYNNNQWIFSRINCIPATKKESTNGGFINNTIQQFKNKDSYIILMSPEGTFKSVEWRSGYYHLAKGLDIPILIFGFDYTSHSPIFGGSFKVGDNLEELQNELMSEFSLITPLYREGSYVKIEDNDIKPTVFAKQYRIIVLILILYYLMC